MSGWKDKLIFDVADLDESDKVGGYLISKSGEVIDSTDVGGKEGLDVNILNDINVDITQDDEITVFQGTDPWIVSATDLDIRDLTAADIVTVAAINSTVDVSDAGGSLTVDDGGSSLTVDGAVTVSGTDIDIRDLVYTQDSVTSYQGTRPWVVSATDLDIRNLVKESDEVTVYQGTDPWITGEAPLASGLITSKAVTTTAALAVASGLADRRKIVFENLCSKAVTIGFTSGVTVGAGISIAKNAKLELENVGPAVDFYVIGATGISGNLIIAEFAI